jgi:hypothetical protein
MNRSAVQYDRPVRAEWSRVTTTRFKVWLQRSHVPPDWSGVVIVGTPWYDHAGIVDITVKGDGSDLRRLIAERQDIFAAYLQMTPERFPTKR